ncbi:MAG TPA: DUF3857 domain-containing protein, partial [Flavitalea sp.]|nr:DUF3857 domain-containing protein [Flavitalea sp.]
MKSILLTVVAVVTALTSYGQSLPASLYSALAIPDSMKKDVDGVYRYREQVIQIRSKSRYISKEREIFTILNESGSSHLNFYEFVDKFNAVPDIEIKIYNAFGQEVKRYKKRDFTTRAAFDGVSLVTDDKVMYVQATSPGYPCTIETVTTKEVSSYLSFPSFNVPNGDHSVETFRFSVEVPADLDIRYRTRNMDIQPVVTTKGENKSYSWEGSNFPGRNIPANGFKGSKHAPVIDIAPNSFEYDGYPGTFKDWKTYGQWNAPFYTEKNPFPEARAGEIRQMVATCKTDPEKVAVLYDYLKKNMRYVSIQLGIGGFKPFPVSFVDTKKYGDCKALTNYMRHMLMVAGIKSYPALINASYDSAPVDLEFPAHSFNHVILCVPQPNDSIWLECTSNISTAGFLGSFT